MPRRVLLLASACLLAAPLALLSTPVAQARSDDSSSPNIVGGTTTTAADHPWQVQVVFTEQGSTYLCGGVLLTDTLVLTAGHCMPSGGLLGSQDLRSYQLYANRTDIDSGGEQLSFDRDAFWVAPNYDEDTLTDDWGLIELSTPSTAGTPLPIASTSESTAWDTGSDAVVTGWGLTSESGSTSKTLRALTIPVLADSACSSSTAYGSDFVSATMLCAGDLAGGKDSCSGDSGGPLQVTTDAGEARLAGLVSWGEGCAEAGKPGVYTRLAGTQIRAELRTIIAENTSVDPDEAFGSTTTDATDTTSTACTKATAALTQALADRSRARDRLTTARKALRTARARLKRLRRHHVAQARIRRARAVVVRRADVARHRRAKAIAAAQVVAERRTAQQAACG